MMKMGESRSPLACAVLGLLAALVLWSSQASAFWGNVAPDLSSVEITRVNSKLNKPKGKVVSEQINPAQTTTRYNHGGGYLKVVVRSFYVPTPRGYMGKKFIRHSGALVLCYRGEKLVRGSKACTRRTVVGYDYIFDLSEYKRGRFTVKAGSEGTSGYRTDAIFIK